MQSAAQKMCVCLQAHTSKLGQSSWRISIKEEGHCSSIHMKPWYRLLLLIMMARFSRLLPSRFVYYNNLYFLTLGLSDTNLLHRDRSIDLRAASRHWHCRHYQSLFRSSIEVHWLHFWQGHSPYFQHPQWCIACGNDTQAACRLKHTSRLWKYQS